MSSFEQIFLDPGPLSIHQAGAKLAKAIKVQVDEHQGILTLSATASDAALPADFRGTVEPNIYAEDAPTTPEEKSIFDDLPVVFELQTAKTDFEHQAEVARILYARMVEKLQWPSVLTSEYSELIAAFDRERGLRTFGPGTLSDGTHEHIWG